MTQSISRQTPTAGPAPWGGACRRLREVPAMVEAQVVGLMKMPVGFMNICTLIIRQVPQPKRHGPAPKQIGMILQQSGSMTISVYLPDAPLRVVSDQIAYAAVSC